MHGNCCPQEDLLDFDDDVLEKADREIDALERSVERKYVVRNCPPSNSISAISANPPPPPQTLETPEVLR
jgi:hypothetical protein